MQFYVSTGKKSVKYVSNAHLMLTEIKHRNNPLFENLIEQR